MSADHIYAVFNRGLVSKRVLGRVDVSRIALSAQLQTNWMPRTLGAMSLRPGLRYLGTTPDDGALIPFIFNNDDTAILEFTPGLMRVWDDGDTLVRRTPVTATVANPGFDTDVASWTDADDGGAASTWATGGYLQLLGTGTASARRRQTLTVPGGETGYDHTLRIIVEKGSILIRIGTTDGADDIYPQSVLREGTHSLTFIPGVTDPRIELSTSLAYPCLVDSITLEGAGGVVTMEIPTPFSTVDVCKSLRWDQSGDVMFIAADGVHQHRIERRENNSWSVVDYRSNDGPFLTQNFANITLTPSALTGEITVTASDAVFKSTHVGSTWQLTSVGQEVDASLSAENTFSDPIFVTGVGTSRGLSIVRSGTWVATVTLQRSIGDIGNWVDVKTYTTNGSETFDDGFDNSDIYYRVGVKTGDFTSGPVVIDLDFPAGSITGTLRITAYTSDTVVTADVLNTLGGLTASDVWREGAWSDAQGWPTAVALYQGRLWWGGNGRLYGSVSDDFTSYDPDFEGDAGPINRAVGDGPVNKVNWLLPMERMIAGTDQREQSIRSNSFDEPITPSNYNSKATSTKGSAPIPASVSNSIGFFVGKNTTDIYELRWNGEQYAYRPVKATLLVPDIAEGGFVRIAHQEEPDVRLHCIRAIGTAAVLVRDEAEDVMAWVDVETDGIIEDVCVLPGIIEDRVFYRVRRVINGITVRYHEEWAQENECRGGTNNLQADSFLEIGFAPDGLTAGGMDHLEGETVVIWAEGKDRGTAVVTAGSVTITDGGANVGSMVIGLPYMADYKSSKLAVQSQLGFDMTRRKKIEGVGLVLVDTHYQGLQYGQDFNTLDDLPLTENEEITAVDTIWAEYDEDTIEFPGDWDTDSRLCMRAQAPRPCTILAAVLDIDRNRK
jgi:hypothetical protein